MKLLLLTAIGAFALGYALNLPPTEAAYDEADIEAMNELTAVAIQPQDWLTQLVVAGREGGHAQ